MQAPRVAFHTFGCKLNQYETEALASAFRSNGFHVVEEREDADVHVINTCTVTSRADHKARTLIRAVAQRRPDEPVIVTGCSAQTEAEALAALADNVVVVPQSEKARLLAAPAVLARALEAGESGVGALRTAVAAEVGRTGQADPFALVAGEYSFHTRAFLKIQDGCDCRCAYCRVPLARGDSVSLGLDEVLRRAVELEARGSREIVLTGVNVSAWKATGAGSGGGAGLSELLGRLLGATARVRFRITSLEPEAIDAELVAAVSHPRVCPHFHIPVQSGSDDVLLRMRRRYRVQKVRDDVRELRAARGDPFVAADILVGFPGETAEDHARTLDLVRELELAAVHVFPFSPRPGTAAAEMRPFVPERVRGERAREVAALGAELGAAYGRRWTGRQVDVLLEAGASRRRKAGAAAVSSAETARGVSENYLKVEVHGIPADAAVPGRIARTEITAAGTVCSGNFIRFQA